MEEILNSVKAKRDEYIIEFRKKKKEEILDAKRFKQTNTADLENDIDFANLSQFEVTTSN